jgi:hypothetical protein
LLATLQRGGDVSVLLRQPESGRLLRQFVQMRKRADGLPPVPRVRRLDDATIGTCAGLYGIFNWRELGELVGMSDNGLIGAVQRWRERMERFSRTESLVISEAAE